jgi:hypothetical protein
MPTVEQNVEAWNGNYDWPKKGEEGSSTWGSSEVQWLGACPAFVFLSRPIRFSKLRQNSDDGERLFGSRSLGLGA